MAKRGRKPTGVTRVTTSFTIATETHRRFDEFCKKNHINKSSIVSSLIDHYMNANNPTKTNKTLNVPSVPTDTPTPSNPAKVVRVKPRAPENVNLREG